MTSPARMRVNLRDTRAERHEPGMIAGSPRHWVDRTGENSDFPGPHDDLGRGDQLADLVGDGACRSWVVPDGVIATGG
jgi:hypothetical protein